MSGHMTDCYKSCSKVCHLGLKLAGYVSDNHFLLLICRECKCASGLNGHAHVVSNPLDHYLQSR